jgi:hypothetical protein
LRLLEWEKCHSKSLSSSFWTRQVA